MSGVGSVVNLLECEVSAPEGLPPGLLHRRSSIRPDLGGRQIGCTVYEVAPGERLWPYHAHWGNEEWAIVVAGTPTLRTVDGERELRAGDVVAFAEGEAGAHSFANRQRRRARVAIFSTLRHGTTRLSGQRQDRRRPAVRTGATSDAATPSTTGTASSRLIRTAIGSPTVDSPGLREPYAFVTRCAGRASSAHVP